MEEQSQVEELQKTVQEQGSKADDVSVTLLFFCVHLLKLVQMLTMNAVAEWLSSSYWRFKKFSYILYPHCPLVDIYGNV